MLKQNKLIHAWSAFGLIAIAFIVCIEAVHRYHASEYVFTCRIMINNDLIIDENDKKPNMHATVKKEELYESTKYGPLPRIMTNGETVFDRYAAKTIANKIIKTVVMVDPESADNLEKVIGKLGENKITFIIPSYINNLKKLVDLILQHGHEFLLLLPTQQSVQGQLPPLFANDDGNKDKLLYLLGSTKGAIGIANISDTLLMKSVKDIELISSELAGRGFMFLNVNGTNDIISKYAEKTGLKYIYIDQTFDINNHKKYTAGDMCFVHLKDFDSFLQQIEQGSALAPITQVQENE